MVKLPLNSFGVYRAPFTSNDNLNQNKTNTKDEYQDPLMKWPVRGLAYSNELGAALSEIAPTLGTLLWFPAMLYFGADFYDKYKNEKTSYNPNLQRGTQQVIFQSLASVIMPTAAVLTGQKAASAVGVLSKSGLSLQTREEVTNFIQQFVSRRHIDTFKDNKDQFKKHFEESLTTKREKLIRNNRMKRPIQFVMDVLFKKGAIALSQKDKVLNYANEKLDQIFNIFDDLTNNRKPKKFNKKLWTKYLKLQETYKKDPDCKDTYIRDAAEDIIMKFQKNQVKNAKWLKTLGGFVALGLAMKPIDDFVENVIIKKYVEPKLDQAFQYNHRQQISKKMLG